MCTGSGTEHSSPGLLLTSRQTTVTNQANLTSCVGGPVTSGTFSFGPFQITAGCLLTAPIGSDEIDYTWNDNTTSHFSGTIVVVAYPVGSIVVSSAGTFTSSRFAGRTVESVITYVAPNPPDCLANPGVTVLRG